MSKEIKVTDEAITNKIYLLRGHRVMLDSDLAELYEVTTGNLNKAVKRNVKRFPEDFMFQLSKEEWTDLKSQNATSGWGGRRSEPYAFTEHGVLMLSSVLNSERAIAVNIRIMRVYNKIKKILHDHSELLLRMEKLERSIGKHDMQIAQVFQLIKQLVGQEEKPRNRIGYKQSGPEPKK